MSDDITQTRVENFTRFAKNLAAFADRQEARGVSQTLVIEPARQASDIATKIAAAYGAGDKDAAKTLRAEYAAILAAHSTLNGIA